MGNTPIEWTEKTWNPVTGCTPISPGCDHCYASRMAKRLAGRSGYPPAPHQFDVTCHPDRLTEPLHWNKPSMIFVCSMGDLFHPDVPHEVVWNIWTIMALCPQHTFQVLTKRPERLLGFLDEGPAGETWRADNYTSKHIANEMLRRNIPFVKVPWPLPNVWLGVTAENQQRADERIPLLLQCPAAVRFVSCEPLLGPVDLSKFDLLTPRNACAYRDPDDGCCLHPDHLTPECHIGACKMPDAQQPIDWAICGGETGPGARPMHPDWARSLRDQCKAAGVAFFFKQWGEWVQADKMLPGRKRPPYTRMVDGMIMQRVGKKRAGRLLDGVEYSEYPDRGPRTRGAAGGCQ